MFIVSPTIVQTLFYDRPGNNVFLTTFRLDTLKLLFKNIFMSSTADAPEFKFFRGVFVNKDTYFVGWSGIRFFTAPG